MRIRTLFGSPEKKKKEHKVEKCREIYSIFTFSQGEQIFNSLDEEPYFFPKCSKKIVFPKKIALDSDPSCIFRKDSISFPENMILFFRQKMKTDLSQKLHGNIFFVYSVKWLFLFPANLILPFFQKSKNDLLPKKYSKR